MGVSCELYKSPYSYLSFCSNAMVYNFMSDGIPIVYYGQEQGFRGAADPVSISIDSTSYS